MYLLDAKVRRRMCKKVLETGGNAVLGYRQSFDMEGDSGLVARTYGTCVLVHRHEAAKKAAHQPAARRGGASELARDEDGPSPLKSKDAARGIMLSLMGEAQSTASAVAVASAAARKRDGSSQDDVRLLTVNAFDPRVRVRIGGLVTARSVKYLGNLASKLSDQETRDGWWTELRDEIKSHAKILCCSHVVGYVESSTIHDDVCVLSVTGTAATVRGLPDLFQAQRLWNEWESQVSVSLISILLFGEPIHLTQIFLQQAKRGSVESRAQGTGGGARILPRRLLAWECRRNAVLGGCQRRWR